MGNYTSKLFYNNTSFEVKPLAESKTITSAENLFVNYTPTTMIQKKLQIDPRSASLEIIRTPIKVNRTIDIQRSLNDISLLQNKRTRKSYLVTNSDINVTPVTRKFVSRSSNIVHPRTSVMVQNTLSYTSNMNMQNKLQSDTLSTNKEVNIKSLDPRSPAIDFDRTPILRVRTLNKSRSSFKENLSNLNNTNSNLDICITLSYCETVSQFNVPEIEALPDIVFSLKKSYNLEDDIDELNLSFFLDHFDARSNMSSNSVASLKYPGNEIDTFFYKLTSEKQFSKDVVAQIEKPLRVNSRTIYSKSFSSSLKETNVNKSRDIQEKFVVWKDSHSSQVSTSFSIRNTNQLEKKINLIECTKDTFTNSTKVNSSRIMEMNEGQSINDKQGKLKGKKGEYTKKENKITKNKIFSPNGTNTVAIQKNRTPLGNMSNSNGQTSMLNSPQQILQKKCVAVKNLQPQTLSKEKKVKCNLNEKLWDHSSNYCMTN